MTKQELIDAGYTVREFFEPINCFYVFNPAGDVLSIPGITSLTEDEAWAKIATDVE